VAAGGMAFAGLGAGPVAEAGRLQASGLAGNPAIEIYPAFSAIVLHSDRTLGGGPSGHLETGVTPAMTPTGNAGPRS